MAGRIAQALMHLAKQPEAMTHPDGMQIKITRQEIGQMVGCSRETVGRIIKMLEDQNLIHAHGKNHCGLRHSIVKITVFNKTGYFVFVTLM